MGCCGPPDERVTGSSDHTGVAAWEGGAVAAVGTVDVKRHGGAWIVGLRGEHDLSTQPMLTRATCAPWVGPAMPSVMEVPLQEVDGGKERSRSRA
jgi:hypothetical protein